ncbi:MAG: sodium:proton antiporter [Rhodocyclaceae bacterium]|jgi:CPA2 family monovalent cation:H+ antiporter-2|nr:sodium:proton antiporter [Rhodocyclaceae bacterium]
MHADIPLIATIAAAFTLALAFGFMTEKIGIPALVGYLLAGIVISPATPGFAGDLHIAGQLSEIGVMLLMFGVGLHFSIKDLLRVKKIAIPGAVFQMAIATALGVGVATFWGWDIGAALVFGVSLSCASTVVLIKALERQGIIESMNGRIAVGWLVVEDLVTVIVLVLLPALASMLDPLREPQSGGSLLFDLGKTLLQVGGFIAAMLLVGKRLIPKLLWMIARTGSRELFTLAVITSAIGIAFGAALLFNVSFALGAFFAGVVLRESELSNRAAKESLPLQDAFSVLFFVSVGMLLDPRVLLENPGAVLAVVGIIVLGKSLAAIALVLLMRYPLNSALTIAASLAQIGEFSFILAGLGLSLGLLPKLGFSLIIAGAFISIALNPFIFRLVEPVCGWLCARSPRAKSLEQRQDPMAELPMSTERRFLQGQVVIVGYGVIGKTLADALLIRQIPFVVAEQNRESVEKLRSDGVAAVYGDAVEPAVLIQAHIADASLLVITANDPVAIGKMVETARTLNPEIGIMVDAEDFSTAQILEGAQLGQVFFSDRLVAEAMVKSIEQRYSDHAS